MAIVNRRPNPGVIFHSDRGTQTGFNRWMQHRLVRLPAHDRGLLRIRPGHRQKLMTALIDAISDAVPEPLCEVIALAHPELNKRAADVLAYFDCPGTYKGPTEAINGRIEHLRGFSNLTNYIARSRVEAGVQTMITPSIVKNR